MLGVICVTIFTMFFVSSLLSVGAIGNTARGMGLEGSFVHAVAVHIRGVTANMRGHRCGLGLRTLTRRFGCSGPVTRVSLISVRARVRITISDLRTSISSKAFSSGNVGTIGALLLGQGDATGLVG